MEVADLIETERIFAQAMEIDPDAALRAALEAQDTDERRFYAYIAYLNLERQYQKEFQEERNGMGG